MNQIKDNMKFTLYSAILMIFVTLVSILTGYLITGGLVLLGILIYSVNHTMKDDK